jgi:hypothetical protein
MSVIDKEYAAGIVPINTEIAHCWTLWLQFGPILDKFDNVNFKPQENKEKIETIMDQVFPYIMQYFYGD